MGAQLVVDALRMAWFRRRPAPGLIFHSDRGSQYASAAYAQQLRAFAMRASMSGKGDCWDNAVAESLFSSLKTESLHRHDFGTRRAGRVTKSWRGPQDTIPRACTPPWAISAPWLTKRNGLPESSQKPHSSIRLGDTFRRQAHPAYAPTRARFCAFCLFVREGQLLDDAGCAFLRRDGVRKPCMEALRPLANKIKGVLDAMTGRVVNPPPPVDKPPEPSRDGGRNLFGGFPILFRGGSSPRRNSSKTLRSRCCASFSRPRMIPIGRIRGATRARGWKIAFRRSRFAIRSGAFC